MVKIILEKLGGTNLEDLGDKTAISEDHTLTWGTMLDATGNGQAEICYKTLAASLSFINGDNTAAEDFTSAAGANGTVNTGSTNATFDTDHYEIGEVPSGTPLNINTANSFALLSTLYDDLINMEFVVLQNCFITAVEKAAGAGATDAYVCSTLTTGDGVPNNILQQTTFSGDTATFSTPVLLTPGTYYIATWRNSDNRNVYWDSSESYPKTDANISITKSYDNASAYTNRTYDIQSVTSEVSEALIDADVVCNTNTLAIDTSTNAFALHWQGDFPTGTSGSFDLISGANTINLPVDSTTKKTGVISKGALGDITNMTITAKLSTTSAPTTPTINGWGITKL